MNKTNKVTKIEDSVSDPTYNGCFNFADGASQSNEYTYDQNGNLTKDLIKKISSIQYNLLNLPQSITYSTNKSATYTYDAKGNKLRVVYTNPSSTIDYCGNMIYEGGALKQILVDGGYNLDGTTNRPAYIGLSHELAHIADRINGSADYGAWVPGNYNTGIIEIPKYEQFACFIENLIRMEHGVSLRSHYGVTTSGKPFEPSRIIDKEGNLFNFRPFSY